MTVYVTEKERAQSSLADLNAERPCGGVFVNDEPPGCCEVHLLPWGHARWLTGNTEGAP